MALQCENLKKNIDLCNCTYPCCSRKGKCCECIHYHIRMDELPACFFPDSIEKTYDRSFRRFAQLYK